ncbi:MAG TPA: sugar phosphate isomerase/epimerase [Acidimicrobiia bacterium]|nr:sugar phosphate isomerase/epimerase [Acidimicrobiia bacterium]
MTATIPIGVQLYTLREEAARDLPGVLARLDATGFVGVEFAGFYGLAPEAIGRALADTNLQVASAHVGLAESDQFKAALDDHAAVGCATVVIPAAPHTGFGDRDQVRATADLVNAANELATERGMTLGYHNHFWELQPLDDGRPALLHFFEHTDPGVIAEVDIYWARVGGADPAAVVTELGPRVELLHVKDGPGDDRAAANVAVGDGAIDTPGVLAAATHARWHLVEFDRCDTDMFDAVERSYEYLVGNGLSEGRT